MRDDVVEKLFALFTSKDRAVAIAGDLAEERDHRGSAWFWLHVAGVTLALWRHAAVNAPLRMLAITIAGCALAIAPAMGGTVAASLFPQMTGSPVRWLAGALCTGAALFVIARRLGLAVSAAFAVAGEALVIACAVVVPSLAAAQQAEWNDPSPHAVKLVTVDTDVQLEVLDWDGSGPALVLLAGLGSTAHHYDDLAPALTGRYRVVGVTRRGHRGSSATPGGYGFARLAEDVLRVIDTVGINNPIVIGHSLAGEEMHVLGARHAAKIRGLVYVDAAFDRGDEADNDAFDAVAKTLPASPGPGQADRASFTALRAFLEKNFGAAGPEAFLRTRYRTNADGSIGGLWAPDLSIRQAMTKEIQAAYNPYNPERIRVPALAIYAVPTSADDLMRRGSSDRLPFSHSFIASADDDPAIRERVEKLFLLTRERVRHHEKWFEAFAEHGRVVELSGTHDLITSNPAEVLEQIEAFVSSLAEKP